MTLLPSLKLQDWDRRWEAGGRDVTLCGYCRALGEHVRQGDTRLERLGFDGSWAAFRLWSFLLSEEDRLRAARAAGKRLVGAMKDLGTVPVMAYSFPNLAAFYPDGAWWIPCVMEMHEGLFRAADQLGLDDSFCPVRAMAGAFATQAHFPIPDLLTCSVGATCDDFSAVAQRLNGMGHPVLWWEIPHRRRPEPGEEAVSLPGGFTAPRCQVEVVKAELDRVRQALEHLAGESLDEDRLAAGIRKANRVRMTLADLRDQAYGTAICPMPGLEMLVAEMLAIHFCSDQDETLAVLDALVAEVRARVRSGTGVLDQDAARLFWVNPVADLRVMNMVEACGARICGTDYLFCHALDSIPDDIEPMEALARTALADPMVGPAADRAGRICGDVQRFKAEAVVVARIPGASHCAWEGRVIAEQVHAQLGLPVVEIEIPPLTDSLEASLCTRLTALVETVTRKRCP